MGLTEPHGQRQKKRPRRKKRPTPPDGRKKIVMLVEAVVLFAGFKMFNGSPHAAQASDIAGDEEGAHGEGGHGGAVKIDKKKLVELNVLEFKAPNKLSGRLFLYDVSVYVTVKT